MSTAQFIQNSKQVRKNDKDEYSLHKPKTKEKWVGKESLQNS